MPGETRPFPSKAPLAFCTALFALAGCHALEEPRNRAALDAGEGYQTTLRDFADEDDTSRVFSTTLRAGMGLSRCRANTRYDTLPVLEPDREEAPISRGDLLRIDVRGDAMLSGDFEIEADGLIRLPQMPAYLAHGVTAETLERRIRKGLVEHGFNCFTGHAACAQKDRSRACQPNDRAFQSDFAGTTIQNPSDAARKAVHYMGRSCCTDAARRVCGRGSDRAAKSVQ